MRAITFPPSSRKPAPPGMHCGVESKHALYPMVRQLFFEAEFFPELLDRRYHHIPSHGSITLQERASMLQFTHLPTNAWEQRTLGEISSIGTGASDLKDACNDGIYPFFVRSDKVERSNRYLFDGEAILIPGEGRLGEIFHYANGKFDYHQRVYRISNISEHDTRFVMYLMMRSFKQHALAHTSKATVDSIRRPVLTSFRLNLPTKREQYIIQSTFHRLDSLITLHQRACLSFFSCAAAPT